MRTPVGESSWVLQRAGTPVWKIAYAHPRLTRQDAGLRVLGTLAETPRCSPLRAASSVTQEAQAPACSTLRREVAPSGVADEARGGLLCKPGADHRTVLAGHQPYSEAKPVSACLHRLTPQLTVADRSIWHGSGTRIVADTCLASSITGGLLRGSLRSYRSQNVLKVACVRRR